jgi:HSP20 family protein
MNELFDRIFGEGFPSLSVERALYPPLSIDETEDVLIIRLDIPGFSREEIEAVFQNDVLTVKGEKKTDEKKESQGMHSHKRVDGFVRRIRIHTKVREDEIRAQCKEEKLIIILPKVTKPPSTRVRITEDDKAL